MGVTMDSFHNPIIPGFYPDPSICRVGEEFYLVTSSFEYFPGVPLFHSHDLVHWHQIGHVLTRPSQLQLRDVPSSYGIYAPTLRYHDGRFYLITTLCKPEVHHEPRHFFVSTDDIHGEWSEPIWITGDAQGDGHDPDLFWDDDGTVYYTRFTWDQGITQWQLDINTGQVLSAGQSIWQGFEDRYCEAPHLYKIQDWYYLIAAEGGTGYGHMVVIARSQHPYGPFFGAPQNPILSHRALVMEPIAATGHGDLIQSPDGTWWLVFLGIRPLEHRYHILGRETFLAPVTWTEDEWPVVNEHHPVTLQMQLHSVPPSAPVSKTIAHDDFDAPTLAPQWNFRRNPVPGSWSLSERSGHFALHCLPPTLDSTEPLSFVGRRQQHFAGEFRALFDFYPTQQDAEAGLCVIQNEHFHYEIAIGKGRENRRILVRRSIGDLQAIVAEREIFDGLIELMISFEHDRYRFSFAQGTEETVVIAEGASKYLSTEVSGGFTGVYLGLYAFGGWADTAYIDWCRYAGI